MLDTKFKTRSTVKQNDDGPVIVAVLGCCWSVGV